MDKNQITFLLIVGCLGLFTGFIYDYLNIPVCEQISEKDEIPIYLVEVGGDKLVSKYQILIVEYDNETWENVSLPFENLSNNTELLEYAYNTTNSSKHLEIYRYEIEGEKIETTFPMNITSKELVCKPRYRWLMERLLIGKKIKSCD